MKKFFAIILTALMLISALPITANAADTDLAYSGAQLDLADVACLDKDLPHGDTIWADIAALEQECLPENAQPEDYAVLYDEVEAIVTASDEYVDGSLERAGDTLYWDTPDGMAHGWSPTLRAEANGWSDLDEVESVETQSVDDGDDSALTDAEFDLSASDMVIPQSDTNDDDLAATGADGDIAGTGVTSTGKNIALFAPYHNYSGDNWPDESELLSDLATITGGTYAIYNNANATIDAIADSLESCAVVIMYTHGNVDRHGAMYDTRISNTSYLTLTTGNGITSADTAWVTGTYGRYCHAFDGGTSDQADSHHIYFVDGTVIANHMDQQAPNNLLWMDSCLTMATDGLCKPLMDKGVGVVYGYSKPSSSVGGEIYTDYFFESLMTGATVSTAARYMKEKASCEWDPLYNNLDYSTALATAVAFPVFTADDTPYPGQRSVDGTQTVFSQWRLPFKNATSFLKRSVLHVNLLQRIDCGFPFTPSFTAVKLLSGSLPAGMKLYWDTSELYVRGTPTAIGAYTATYQLTSGSANYTLQFDIAVVKNPYTEKTYNYSFTSGNSFSKDIDPDSNYFSCTRVSGELPPNVIAKMTADGLHIETNSYTNSSGKTVAYNVLAGEYTSLYDIVTRGGVRYQCTVNITVKPKSTTSLSDRTVTMARGLKGIVGISNERYFRIEIESGSIPNGTQLISRNGKPFSIIGTPAAAGSYTVNLKLYKWNGEVHTMKLTVNVNEPSVTDCTVNLHNLSGNTYSTATRKGNSSYTLPAYTESLPTGVRFSGWWYNNNTYQPGASITVDALTVDIYALCVDIEPIKSVGVSGVVAPKAGAAPTYAATAPSGAFYKVEDYNDSNCWKNGVCWYDWTGREMSFTDTFVAGKQYSAQISLVPKSSEYTFATSGLNGTVNTNPAKVGTFNSSTATKNIYVQYTFTCPAPIAINSVTITGITESIAGAAPIVDCTIPANSGYRTAVYDGEVTWYTEDGDILNPNTDKFKAGERYSAQVTLLANDGYEFAEPGLTGTINGKDATKSIFRSSAKRINISRWFTCVTTTVIRSVTVTGVTAPAAGATPSYTASVPNFTTYLVEDYSDNNCWKNGVCWYDWTGREMSFTDTFVGGKQYTARVSLVPSSQGYRFATSGLSGTLNGYTATVKAFDSASAAVNIYAQYTFTVNGTIDHIEISGVTAPVAGTKPTFAATVPNGAGYELNPSASGTQYNGVRWSTWSGRTIVYLTANDVFEAGKNYTARVYIHVADDDYALATSGLTATLNGMTATVSYSRDIVSSTSCIVTYNFTCQAATGILGDADEDGEVTLMDATLIQRKLVQLKVTGTFNETAADVDKNGTIEVTDATWIQRHVAKMEIPYKVGEPTA